MLKIEEISNKSNTFLNLGISLKLDESLINNCVFDRCT